ncbi:MAG: hypothetical protein C4524_13540 [Candidatus Zixiibacteriota bacterium]|nr:MAG: hypothetical protein C4524_13540 [candidate division Zixibacteria bacterium]
MPFCPNDRYEYLPGITHCPDCGAELVDELPDMPAPDVRWVKMKDLPGMVYAQMVAEVLEQRGVPHYIQSLFGSGGLGVVTGANFAGSSARIWVPEDYLDQAQEIQDEMMQDI